MKSRPVAEGSAPDAPVISDYTPVIPDVVDQVIPAAYAPTSPGADDVPMTVDAGVAILDEEPSAILGDFSCARLSTLLCVCPGFAEVVYHPM